ncbi:MAG TPA: hypothetical protein VK934_04905 [Fimbriimonas sp.]|nr:hypothetical protein [Fimbriimonas sp.]
MSSVLVALVLLQTPASLFDKSLSAYSRLPELNARVDVESSSGGIYRKGTITFLSDAKGLVMRLQQPAAFGYERSDRVYRVVGSTLDGYDLMANEKLTRQLPPVGSPADRMAFALGTLEEAPAVLLKRERMQGLFKSLRGMKGWKVSRGPGTFKLTRSSTRPAQQTRIAFGATNYLIRELWMKNPTNELHWTITYGGAKPSFSPRADARTVQAFTQLEAPPKFASSSARQQYEAMLRAAAGIRSGTVVVKDETSTVRTVFQGRSVRERQQGMVWLYDGRNLSVYNESAKRFYTGRALRSDVIDLVAKCGGRVDAFTRYVVLRRVPFRDLLPSSATVTVGGSLVANGVRRTILQATSPGKRFSISVRGDNRLPGSLYVGAVDRQGRLLSGSTRLYEYININKSQSAADFKLSAPKGVVRQSLPKLR